MIIQLHQDYDWNKCLESNNCLLELDNFVSGDKYIFFRDAYLQRRKYEISDGEIDADDFVDEFEDF